MPSQIEHRGQFLIGFPVSDGSIVILLKVLEAPIAVLPGDLLDHVVFRLANVDGQSVLGVFACKGLS